MIKYKEVLKKIESDIESGKYKSNQKLPTENELCELYDVSKSTIKKAMLSLTEQGYVYRRRGDGTYVHDLAERDYIKEQVSRQFGGFTNINKGKKLGTELLVFELINPSAEIAQKLKITVDNYVYYVKRLRFIDDQPSVIERSYISIDVIPGLTKKIAEKSIHKYIENELGLKIKTAHRQIRAKIATEEQQKFFNTDISIAILEYEQLVFLDNGCPFQYSISENRGDTSKSVSILNR